MRSKVSLSHLERRALVYVRQSTMMQVHEHVESKQRQYALAERAASLGWPQQQVEVIDDDQGKSGASREGRTGFARLAEAVAHGQAGAIFALEISRLARSSTDWQQLLQVCAVANVLVVDEQTTYDPADKDDKLLLDLKGTMSEVELNWLRLRLVGGRTNKARRGKLELRPPTGYVWTERGFVLDPDESVQRAVRLLFERFAVEPTAWAVVSWAQAQGLQFPTRKWQPGGTSEVQWRRLTLTRIVQMLHNPVYAGVYAYGRRQKRKVLIDGQVRARTVRLADPKDWAVCIQDAHPGYISWETFVNNQEKLRQNQSKPQGATRGAPHKGSALLAGVLVCGRCGRRMRTFYEGAKKHRHNYVCLGEHHEARSTCWSVPGIRVDQAVETLFLETMVPDELDLSLAVEQQAEHQAESLQQQWRSRIDQARYTARLAERRYKAVDPDNRTVARTLEREWEARLQDLEQAEQQYAEAKRTRHVELTDEDRKRIQALARDLPTVWRASTTDPAERKAMLRLVIEAISLSPIDVPRRATRVRVQWQSGVVSELNVDRPYRHRPEPEAIERLRQLAAASHHDEVIADMLNAEGLQTGKLKPWNVKSVRRARRKEGIPRVAPDKPKPRFLPDRHPVTGRYSVPGAARHFGVSQGVVTRWIDSGRVRMHHEHYGRYNARWLDIDEATAEQLTKLVAARHSSGT